MAIRALEDRIVSGIRVAGCADSTRVAVVRVEPGMVERCARPPGNNLMTRLAGGRESSRDVVGIVCGLILSLVTRVTIRWKRSVIVVHMATRARDAGMRTHQREGCVVMVE